MAIESFFSFSQNWQEFPIASFNNSDVKCIAVNFWQIQNTDAEKNQTKKKPVSINLWNTVYVGEKIAFFPALFLNLSLSLCLKYDKYAGLMGSEYWVHITQFIATFWQLAPRNKANIMTAIKDKYCTDHVYFITTL